MYNMKFVFPNAIIIFKMEDKVKSSLLGGKPYKLTVDLQLPNQIK